MSSQTNKFTVKEAIEIGGDADMLIIAGPCAIESRALVEKVADELERVGNKLGIPIILKNSFDKANRLSVKSPRGVGLEKGLQILDHIKQNYDLPLLVDIHETIQVDKVAQVADILQIPAFLSRQTDLIVAAAQTGLPVNIKKGQFLAPEDIKHSADKASSCGNHKVSITERGTSFGYRNLVVDFRSLEIMKQSGYPTVLDITHSLQRPGGKGGSSGGDAEFAFPLAKAGVSLGVDALYMEVHPNPSQAISDQDTQLRLDIFEDLAKKLFTIYNFFREKNLYTSID